MKEITLRASTKCIPVVIEFVANELERYACPKKLQMQIAIAIDEIYSNIALYAYDGIDSGEATVRLTISHNPSELTLAFIDSGKPYNPLEKEDPDVTLSAEERQLGGLGIFMVKKCMDEMVYDYKDGCNMLTIKKGW